MTNQMSPFDGSDNVFRNLSALIKSSISQVDIENSYPSTSENNIRSTETLLTQAKDVIEQMSVEARKMSKHNRFKDESLRKIRACKANLSNFEDDVNVLRSKLDRRKFSRGVKSLIGTSTSVIQGTDEGTGRLTYGIIAEILTDNEYHPGGTKVRLKDGTVGRISSCTAGSNTGTRVADYGGESRSNMSAASHQFAGLYGSGSNTQHRRVSDGNMQEYVSDRQSQVDQTMIHRRSMNDATSYPYNNNSPTQNPPSLGDYNTRRHRRMSAGNDNNRPASVIDRRRLSHTTPISRMSDTSHTVDDYSPPCVEECTQEDQHVQEYRQEHQVVDQNDEWHCPECTFVNSGLMPACEMCEFLRLT